MNFHTEETETLLTQLKKLLNDHLESLIPSDDSKGDLYAAVKYSLMGAGKQLRPLILLFTTQLFNGDPSVALNPACALEMIHTYSLIHDDLPAMDNDDFRRGLPTLHRAFPEATAILAGDYLLTEAFGLLSNTSSIDPEIRLKLIQELAEAAGGNGMIGGQALDMAAEDQILAERDIIEMYRLKTASLLALSFSWAGRLSGLDEPSVQILKAYGINFGIAFQVIDDVLDVTKSFEHKGCAQSSDIENHKSTLVQHLGVEGTLLFAKNLVSSAEDMLKLLPVDTTPLILWTNKIIFRGCSQT